MPILGARKPGRPRLTATPQSDFWRYRNRIICRLLACGGGAHLRQGNALPPPLASQMQATSGVANWPPSFQFLDTCCRSPGTQAIALRQAFRCRPTEGSVAGWPGSMDHRSDLNEGVVSRAAEIRGGRQDLTLRSASWRSQLPLPACGTARNRLFLLLHAHSSLARRASMPVCGPNVSG